MLRLVATARHFTYMPPSMASVALTLTSLPGVHDALCYYTFPIYRRQYHVEL